MKLNFPTALILVSMLSSPAMGSFQPSGSRPQKSLAASSATSTLFFIPPPPPNTIGAPGRRTDGAGARCPAESFQDPPSGEHPLTALVPLYESASPRNLVFGKTMAEQPTFWVYVPYHPSYSAKVLLNNADGENILEKDVSLPEAPGIIRVELPIEVEAEATYEWFFYITCDTSHTPQFHVSGSL